MAAYQIYEGCLTGNCEFCGQKEDCVLLSILQKVNNLESIVEKTSAQTVLS